MEYKLKATKRFVKQFEKISKEMQDRFKKQLKRV
jgi:mRNA-degrading endonuclease RelE of RelBE toxin-antitoxin system